MNVSLPSSLSYSQISEVIVDPIRLSVSILFVEPLLTSVKQHQMDFRKVLLFSVSKSPDDEDGCYVVGSVEINIVNDVQKLVERIYPGSIKYASPPNSAYHLHIEGDLCCDVVSEDYAFAQS